MAAGLIKGGDLDNAIVIYENEMSQEKLDKLADSIGVPHHDATEKRIFEPQASGMGKRTGTPQIA